MVAKKKKFDFDWLYLTFDALSGSYLHVLTHRFKLLKILAKEKILSIFIWESTIPKIWQAKNPIVGNIVSCFFPLYLFHIHLITLENQQFFFNKLFCWLNTPCYHLNNIQIVVIVHFLVNKTIIRFYHGCKW